MSIGGIKRIRSVETLQLTDVFLPNEIWQVIAGYLSERGELRHVSSFALTASTFFKICIDSCARFRIRNAFAFHSRISIEKLTQHTPSMICKVGLNRIDLKDSKRHYVRQSQGVFFILNIENLQIAILDLDYEITQHPEITKSPGICSCFQTEMGFISVTCHGCIFWRWGYEGFTFVNYVPLFSKDENNWIASCSFSEGKLLVYAYSGEFSGLDTQSENPIFYPIKNDTGYDCWCLKTASGKHYMWSKSAAQSDAVLSQVEFSYVNQAWELTLSTPPISDLWGCKFIDGSEAYEIDPLKEKILMQKIGGNLLNRPAAEMHEQCETYADFLFSSYKDGSFWLFDLEPEAHEYFLDIKALQDYLKQTEGILYWLGLTRENGVTSLKIIFQKQNQNGEWFLYSLTVALDIGWLISL